MKLTPEAHRLVEDYFRHYYDDDSLAVPDVQIYSRRGAYLVTRILSVHGITLGRHIFIFPDLTCRDGSDRLCMSKNLLIHELTHTLQYERLGFVKFLKSYLTSYFYYLRKKGKWDLVTRMNAYLQIPHEIEAREAAAAFPDWYFNRLP